MDAPCAAALATCMLHVAAAKRRTIVRRVKNLRSRPQPTDAGQARIPRKVLEGLGKYGRGASLIGGGRLDVDMDISPAAGRGNQNTLSVASLSKFRGAFEPKTHNCRVARGAHSHNSPTASLIENSLFLRASATSPVACSRVRGYVTEWYSLTQTQGRSVNSVG